METLKIWSGIKDTLFIQGLQSPFSWHMKVLGDSLINDGSHDQHIFSSEDHMISYPYGIDLASMCWAPIISKVVCYELLSKVVCYAMVVCYSILWVCYKVSDIK